MIIPFLPVYEVGDETCRLVNLYGNGVLLSYIICYKCTLFARFFDGNIYPSACRLHKV